MTCEPQQCRPKKQSFGNFEDELSKTCDANAAKKEWPSKLWTGGITERMTDGSNIDYVANCSKCSLGGLIVSQIGRRLAALRLQRPIVSRFRIV